MHQSFHDPSTLTHPSLCDAAQWVWDWACYQRIASLIPAELYRIKQTLESPTSLLVSTAPASMTNTTALSSNNNNQEHKISIVTVKVNKQTGCPCVIDSHTQVLPTVQIPENQRTACLDYCGFLNVAAVREEAIHCRRDGGGEVGAPPCAPDHGRIHMTAGSRSKDPL